MEGLTFDQRSCFSCQILHRIRSITGSFDRISNLRINWIWGKEQLTTYYTATRRHTRSRSKKDSTLPSPWLFFRSKVVSKVRELSQQLVFQVQAWEWRLGCFLLADSAITSQNYFSAPLDRGLISLHRLHFKDTVIYVGRLVHMNKWHVTAVVLLCFIWGDERGISSKLWELTCDLCCPQSSLPPLSTIGPWAHFDQMLSGSQVQSTAGRGSWCYLSAILVLSSVLPLSVSVHIYRLVCLCIVEEEISAQLIKNGNENVSISNKPWIFHY